MKPLSWLLALCLCPFLQSCRRGQDYAGQIIDTKGTYPCFHGDLTVEIWNTSPTELNYTVADKHAKAGPSKPAFKEGQPWMICPERVGFVWIYDGANDVSTVELDGKGGSKFVSSQVVPELIRAAPKDFLDRLPAKLKGGLTLLKGPGQEPGAKF